MFEYMKYENYFAQIAGGIEKIGAEELKELGASNVKAFYRGAYFSADKSTLYKIVYNSRLITRVLAPLKRFDCHSDKYLYKTAYSIEWDQLFSVDDTFAITANVSNSNINHSKYASLKLKDAIADYFRDKHGRRPNVDIKDPDIWLNLHIGDNRALISIDVSGGAMHKRNYRKKTVDAPMQETLAAAMIRLSGWDGTTRLYDPFCGSGTILAEAYMFHCNIPAGFLRKKFGFEKFPDFDADIWQSIKEESDAKIVPLEIGVIGGSDISKNALSATRKNLEQIAGSKSIYLRVSDFSDIESLDNTTIVTNPPYGIRLGTEEEVSLIYRDFGNFLKRKCKDSTAYIFIGNRKLIGRVGLKSSRKIPLVNGSIDGRLCEFKMYRDF